MSEEEGLGGCPGQGLSLLRDSGWELLLAQQPPHRVSGLPKTLDRT